MFFGIFSLTTVIVAIWLPRRFPEFIYIFAAKPLDIAVESLLVYSDAFRDVECSGDVHIETDVFHLVEVGHRWSSIDTIP